jgi:hypothetical protein
LLNPDDLDSPAAVARIVVVQYLSDMKHLYVQPITNLAWEFGSGRTIGSRATLWCL